MGNMAIMVLLFTFTYLLLVKLVSSNFCGRITAKLFIHFVIAPVMISLDDFIRAAICAHRLLDYERET